MKVLVAKAPTSSGWSRFHRDAGCPGLRKGEVTHGAEYVAVELADLPDKVLPCQFECCFPGHETAADLTSRVHSRPAARPATGIRIGHEVEYRELGGSETEMWRIVRGAANLNEGELSANTPIARALIGREPGEVVDIALPNRVVRVEIGRVRS
jgi:Transcription elongation factor, GreA/GreB, C-term